MKKLFLTFLVFVVSSGVACAAGYSGEYSYRGKGFSNYLTVKDLGTGKVHIEFMNSATMSSSRVNTGMLEFDADVNSAGKAEYRNNEEDESSACNLVITFKKRVAIVEQLKGRCDAGEGVSFDGKYKLSKKKGRR